MKHIRNKTVLAMAAAVALLLCGCTKELPNEDFGEESYLSLSIDGQQAPSSAAAYDIAAESATRQGAATRAVPVNEVIVNNVWVLQFKMTSATAGTLVKREYFSSVPATYKIKYSPEAGANMALYLVANTNDAALFTQTAIGATLASVKTKALTITTSAGNNFPADTSNNLPMVGQSTNMTLPTTTAVPVTLTRTVAKVTLTVKNLLTTSYPQLTVTSTQLKNVPRSYSMQLVNTASGYYPSASAGNFTTYTAVSGNITATGTTTTYYVAPNVRGIGTATDDRLKGPDTAPSGQGAYCTYVEILGTAKATSSSPAVDVCYRLYLGGNSTNNYNLYSNTAYKVGIELTGLSAADARLTITTDKFDLVQGGIDGDHTSDAGDGWVEPVIGDLKDGGIVYEIDGSTYKVFSLKQADLIQWSIENNNVLGSTGQNMTDGKLNVAAMKSYASSKNLTFSTYFLAASFCDEMNTGGVTGWYLPAIDEMVAFYTAYTTNKAVLDAAISTNGGTAMAKDEYNGFWSSTEFSGMNNENACFIRFSSTQTSSRQKGGSGYVRCIRRN